MKKPLATLLVSALASCLSSEASLDLVDGQRVLQHVETIVSFGPHPAGSEAQQKVTDYISARLRETGLEVRSQEFEAVTPLGRRKMANVWAIKPGQTNRVILLASHYDSKYFEEFSFVGANDGGSSTGLLLELARLLATRPARSHTLWFVFFDGEESFREWTSLDSLYGSRQFVRMLEQRGELRRISAMILLDMVGGKELALRREYNSTQWLNDILWEQAAAMGHSNIFKRRGTVAAEDDHLPFVRKGIPAVDLIDLNYAYWHRAEDTLDKLSAENLSAVGNVVLASLPEIELYLSRNER